MKSRVGPRRYLIAVLAAVGIALSGLTGPAQASTAGSEEIPEKSKLVRVEHGGSKAKPLSVEAFKERAKASGNPATKAELAAAMDSGCWEAWASQWGENVFGAKIWQYNQEIYWCGDGTWVTHTGRASAWGEVFIAYGWTYEGRDPIEYGGGVNWSGWEVSSQGHFCLGGVDPIGCVQSAAPRNFQLGGGDGAHYYSFD